MSSKNYLNFDNKNKPIKPSLPPALFTNRLSNNNCSQKENISLKDKLREIPLFFDTFIEAVNELEKHYPKGSFTLNVLDYEVRRKGKVASSFKVSVTKHLQGGGDCFYVFRDDDLGWCLDNYVTN